MAPKMSSEYLANKRDEILNAALTVCMKKPMYEVSMRDVITECGFSQGNIYRYFSNIDEILIELINRESTVYNIKKLTDAVISSNIAPEQVIGELFSIWEKAILDNIIGIGKIYYEMCVIYASNKERLNYFVSNIAFTKDESYLWENFYKFIIEKITTGYFKPKIQGENIAPFQVIALDGIMRDLVLHNHYGIALPFPGTLEKTALVRSFCTAFILLLGGNEKLIYVEENEHGSNQSN